MTTTTTNRSRLLAIWGGQPTRFTGLFLGVLVVLAMTVAGCGSGDEPEPGDNSPPADTASEIDDGSVPADAPSTATAAIVTKGTAFDPPAAVAAGAQVTVVNEDPVAHTVTSDDQLFDVTVDGGSQTTITAPSEPGSYPFHCNIHPSMTATLVVE